MIEPNISSYGIAIVDREIARIEQRKSNTTSSQPFVSQEEQQLIVLHMVREVLSRLDTGTLIDSFSQPVLWHTDLHMGNIFVSSEDPTKVVSIIDWQSISIAPLLIQARFPGFPSVDPNFVLDSSMLELSGDYASLNDADKQIAQYKTRPTRMAKVYEVATPVHNS